MAVLDIVLNMVHVVVEVGWMDRESTASSFEPD